MSAEVVTRPSGGSIRRYHVEVLLACARLEVTRHPDWEYYATGRRQRVTEAVYLLEAAPRTFVRLHVDGSVTCTSAGRRYLDSRGVDVQRNTMSEEELPVNVS